MGGVTVLIPTLNERENVDPLLEQLIAIRERSELYFDILFIDSASPDGTGQKVLEWKEKGGVDLLQLERNIGLAGAVLRGAAHTNAEFLLVMDADLSHPPEKVVELLRPVVSGEKDMMIGSRYAEGGTTQDWPFRRRLSSRIATLPALCFCSVSDPLAGFFALRRDLLLGLPGSVPGFKIGLAVLAHYGCDLRVGELPIEFRDRDFGESKMGKAVIAAYLWQLVGICRDKITNIATRPSDTSRG